MDNSWRLFSINFQLSDLLLEKIDLIIHLHNLAVFTFQGFIQAQVLLSEQLILVAYFFKLEGPVL